MAVPAGNLWRSLRASLKETHVKKLFLLAIVVLLGAAIAKKVRAAD